jgi:hypothetical protein
VIRLFAVIWLILLPQSGHSYPPLLVAREEVAQLVAQLAVHSISNHQSGIHNGLARAVVDSTQLIVRQLFTALERIDLRVKKNFVRASVPNS